MPPGGRFLSNPSLGVSRQTLREGLGTCFRHCLTRLDGVTSAMAAACGVGVHLRRGAAWVAPPADGAALSPPATTLFVLTEFG